MADRGLLHRIALASRIKTLPVSLGSVLIVAADATQRDEPVALARIVACLVIAAAMHVAGILVSDLHDHAAGTDKLARLDRNAMPTGSLQLEAGTLRRAQIAATAVLVVLLAGGLVAWLGTTDAWAWFGAGLACVWSYAGPPLRVAYVGSGFGELLIAAAYGPLLAGGTAAALGIELAAGAWIATGVVGVLVATAFGSHHFLHWRADREAFKRTPAVAFGEDGGLLFLGLVDLAAYLTLGIAIAVGALPPLCTLAFLGAPGIAASLRRAQEDPVAQRILAVIGTHLAAVVFAVLGTVIGIVSR